MGKKTKKKGGNAAKRKTQNATRPKQTAKKPQPKLDSDQSSLYRIYKYCTEAVIQWGKATYFKKHSKKPKKGSSNKASLSHIIFDILGSLATDGVLMPELVLDDLKLAISYRKKVGKLYRILPDVSEEEYARHEWLIQQLEKLAKAFRENNQQQESDVVQEEEAEVRKGFDVLALSDDEESVAPTESDAESSKKVFFETPPTPEELEREERQFAISLFMYEIDSIRNSLRERWKKWAERATSSDDDAAENLLAITSSTEYALSAARKSVLQMSLDIDDFPDIDQLIILIGDASSNYQNEKQKQTDFKEGDLVTVHSLEKRSDLNGRHGFICSPVDPTANRISLQLFPSDAYSTPDKQQTISVKPENFFLSDNTYLRLCQIHSTMGSLNLKLMDTPNAPQLTYMAPTSTSVQKFGTQMIMQGDKFQKAARKADFQNFLSLTVQYSLPLWISLAKYLPDAGAADTILNAYIRDYSKDEKLKFPLAFALLVAIDSAIECERVKDTLAEDSKNLYVNVLRSLFTTQSYTPAIRLLERDGMKADCLYSHVEFTKHLYGEYSVAAMFFPLVSGECMLTGLRMHFVCGTGLPYANVNKYLHVLHIYWVLRSEGYLGKIRELESVISIYRQQVFFRGGLAKKGDEAYLKCQQLALGVSVQGMRYLDGKAATRKTGRAPFNSDALGMDGLHVSEISRLLDILQWKSMPIVDKESCFNEIEGIAREEYSKVFRAPILDVSVKLSKIARILEVQMAHSARESGKRMMDNFSILTSRMPPLELVSFWVMALGDNRSIVPGEKDQVLSLLASVYARIFPGGTEQVNPDEEPAITFSTNEHKVDSSLWGEKGVRKVENLHIA